jgi:radical SAM family uncharacterized protein/radical SAM-linked protein
VVFPTILLHQRLSVTRLDQHPYAPFLAQVHKPTRYTGAEHGVRQKDWGSVLARVCLAFPDVYDIGMSHLGFRILYQLLNDDDELLAERCYTPWIDMQEQIRAHGLPLVSLESTRPLHEFDVVGFSLQYELTYTNVLTMLDLGGIPLRSDQRRETDPLVVAGGPVATHAEPMAPFLDALLVGDGEEAAGEIARQWANDRRAGLGREERLVRLARIEGVYVPSLYATAIDASSGLEVVTGPARADVPFPVRRRLVPDLAKFPFPDRGPVGGPEAIFDRMSIEVARGCTEGCRFCQAGMIYRPVRERDPGEVVATVLRAIEHSGQDEVSLTALSTADVSCISPMIRSLVEKTAPQRVSLSVASLRAYGLSEDLLDDMSQVRAAGLTFAPEAGTQRMRDVINKNVTEEQLLETANRVFSRGHDKMKLYFIIGLPTETEEDVQGIVEVGRNALAVGKQRRGGRAKITVSVSTHVPKPHTPFQWCAMDTLGQIQEKQSWLRDAVRSEPRALQLRLHDAETSVLEGVLARGDRRLGAAIEYAYRDGARFDSWEDQLDLGRWQRALDHAGVDTDRYLGTIPVDARLPWDHIDVGLEPGFLVKEYRKALKSRLSPPCSKAVGQFIHHTNLADAQSDQRKLVCYHCGVACDLTQMRAERLDFLRSMNALTPGNRVHLPVVEPSQQHRPGRYRPPQPGGPAQRWRLRYTKRGPAALLGHLDLIRELGRILRRAALTVWYTQGFHPKPDFSFGPALGLGAASLGEYVDVKLIDAPPAAVLLAQLATATAPGLDFTGAAPLCAEDSNLAGVVDSAEYLLGLDVPATGRIGGREAIAARIAALMSKESLIVWRQHKGRTRPIDVRGALSMLQLGGSAERDLFAEAEVSGVLLPIRARIAMSPAGTARPAEVVTALTDDEAFPHRVVRVGLLAGDRTPLDVIALAAAGATWAPGDPPQH